MYVWWSYDKKWIVEGFTNRSLFATTGFDLSNGGPV